MRADEFAALLGGKRVGRGHYVARCPAHADKHPSLSIGEGKKHPVVFHCMSAGCTQAEVLKAMGLCWKDLLGDRAPLSREARGRLADEQTLRALRDLIGVEASRSDERVTYYGPPIKNADPLIAMLVLSNFNPYRVEALVQSIIRRIEVLENKLYPEIKARREREAKTYRFVRKWGWDRLWSLYFEKQKTA